jgi:hypothetical protein
MPELNVIRRSDRTLWLPCANAPWHWERRTIEPAALPRRWDAEFMQETRAHYRAIQGSFKAQCGGADLAGDALMVAER